ncbi:MAG: ABC transporter permease, partial [Dokdonella sp.]
PQPQQLVLIGKGDGHSWSMISPQQYQLLSGIAGVQRIGTQFPPKDVNVAGGGEPDLVSAWPVDAGLLPTTGVTLTLGRNFSAEEDRPHGPPAAILGYAFWQRHFSGDAGVIGRSVLIDGVATPVVGVLPATFRLDGAPDVLLPLALAAGSRDSATNLLVFARLTPGVSIETASAGFDARLQTHASELGFANAAWHPCFSVTTLAQNLGATARPILLLFFGCALCVLLLVAMNLSNLRLLRAIVCSLASAVRAALGAWIAQLALRALGEGLLIGVCGVAGGLLLAAAALGFGRAWLPQAWIAPQSALFGWHAFALAIVVAALAVAILAALFGVWRGLGAASARELVSGGRVGASVTSQRFGRGVVLAQAALATLLLASSALLAHSPSD